MSLLAILDALGPVFFIIVLGYGFRRSQFPGEAFWLGAERLTYFLLFPVLLIRELALADLEGYAVLPFAGAIIATLLAMSGLLFALKPYLAVDGPGFSSIYQGSIRFNTYVGLAAAGAVFHGPGLALAALAIAVLVPLVNLLCVGVLSLAAGGAVAIQRLLGSLAANPLILACGVGIFLNRSGLGLPPGSATVVDILARAALPLGLLTVGAGLQVRAVRTQTLELALASAFKLLLMPVLSLAFSYLMVLSRLETAILVLFTALPGAPSSYILARQLGGDAPLMAAIVTVETGLSLLTLPVILILLMALP